MKDDVQVNERCAASQIQYNSVQVGLSSIEQKEVGQMCVHNPCVRCKNTNIALTNARRQRIIWKVGTLFDHVPGPSPQTAYYPNGYIQTLKKARLAPLMISIDNRAVHRLFSSASLSRPN